MQVKLGKVIEQRIKYVGKCPNCEAELACEPNELHWGGVVNGVKSSSPHVICPQCETQVLMEKK
jgi:hypothetical protein